MKGIIAIVIVILMLNFIPHGDQAFAVSISDLVDTPTELSFNFQGSGHSDYLEPALKGLQYWDFRWDDRTDEPLSLWAWEVAFQHLIPSRGPFLEVGLWTKPFGSASDRLELFRHGSATDVIYFSALVRGVPNLDPQYPQDSFNWADFSGSLKIVHFGPIPDAGATGLLLLSGLAGMILLRRKIC